MKYRSKGMFSDAKWSQSLSGLSQTTRFYRALQAGILFTFEMPLFSLEEECINFGRDDEFNVTLATKIKVK